jgi:hypothetical protein
MSGQPSTSLVPQQVKSIPSLNRIRGDFMTFLNDDRANRNILLAAVMENFLNEVDDISTKDVFSFQEVKNKFLKSTLSW